MARTGSEAVITGTLAYLRGDSDQIVATVDVEVVLDRVEQAVIDHARTAMAAVAIREVGNIEEYRVAVEVLAASVSIGRIPETIPVPAHGLDRRQVVGTLTDVALRFGVDPLTVQAFSDAGGDRDALVVAATEGLRAQAKAARQDLEARLDEGRTYDAIDQLAQREGETRAHVVAKLDTVRDLVAWFGTWTFVGGVTSMVLGSTTLIALYRHAPAGCRSCSPPAC